ncbi:hypothetical protein Bca4012_009471 [Brassica carinata]|uniref:Uncharacterized protein n=1 Tax=Brassica carinata TaxID=52824 RepID=A0A8X7S1V2_BRACI|nr:hypothetical protein Bca52824_034739 [Brassica carinata]
MVSFSGSVSKYESWIASSLWKKLEYAYMMDKATIRCLKGDFSEGLFAFFSGMVEKSIVSDPPMWSFPDVLSQPENCVPHRHLIAGHNPDLKLEAVTTLLG